MRHWLQHVFTRVDKHYKASWMCLCSDALLNNLCLCLNIQTKHTVWHHSMLLVLLEAQQPSVLLSLCLVIFYRQKANVYLWQSRGEHVWIIVSVWEISYIYRGMIGEVNSDSGVTWPVLTVDMLNRTSYTSHMHYRLDCRPKLALRMLKFDLKSLKTAFCMILFFSVSCTVWLNPITSTVKCSLPDVCFDWMVFVLLLWCIEK
jgi:hypothetical protein